ncbi:MAG: 4Fe-4S binding protein, partial [Thermoproteota archaeon]
IYLAGAAQGPKDIPSAVAQALAASGKAAERVLSKDAIAVEPVVAEVRAERCSKCAICLPVCPFGALRIAEVGGKEQVVVEEAKCKGCGACVAACPSSALDLRHYRERQIVEPIREAAI